MKVKNIAFSGFAAAILATGAANAAPQIASKAYVDNVKTSTLTEVANTYVTNEAAKTFVTETQLGDQITNIMNDETSELSKELAGKADSAVVDGIKTDVDGLKTAVGDATSGLTKDVADVKTDLTALDGRVTKNTQDIASLSEGIDKTVADAIAGALTGEGEIKDAIDNAISDAVGDLPIGTLTTDVNNLKDTVGDATKGLVKDNTDNKSAIAANKEAIDTLNGGAETAGSVANTVTTMAIPKPKAGDCAESDLCVLSVKPDGTLGWTGVTAPVDE